MPIEYTRNTRGDRSRVIMYECPACDEYFGKCDGKTRAHHFLNAHTEDDFGDVEAYKQDNSRHVLFDEPEIDEPMAGVSA